MIYAMLLNNFLHDLGGLGKLRINLLQSSSVIKHIWTLFLEQHWDEAVISTADMDMLALSKFSSVNIHG